MTLKSHWMLIAATANGLDDFSWPWNGLNRRWRDLNDAARPSGDLRLQRHDPGDLSRPLNHWQQIARPQRTRRYNLRMTLTANYATRMISRDLPRSLESCNVTSIISHCEDQPNLPYVCDYQCRNVNSLQYAIRIASNAKINAIF